MGCVCEIIGEIKDTSTTIDRVCGDPSLGEVEERFYCVNVELRACTIPMVISEFNLDKIIKGKVKITGSLFSDCVPSQLPRFYIYANKLEPADPDVELTNEVAFTGTVTKVKPASVDAFGRDVVSMYLSTVSPLNTESVLFLVLKGQMARINKNLSPRFKVNGTGYIKPYRDVYEVLVTKFEVIQ